MRWESREPTDLLNDASKQRAPFLVGLIPTYDLSIIIIVNNIYQKYVISNNIDKQKMVQYAK